DHHAGLLSFHGRLAQGRVWELPDAAVQPAGEHAVAGCAAHARRGVGDGARLSALRGAVAAARLDRTTVALALPVSDLRSLAVSDDHLVAAGEPLSQAALSQCRGVDHHVRLDVLRA